MSNLKLFQRAPDRAFFTDEQKRAMGRAAQLMRIYREQFPNGLPHNGLGLKYSRYICRTMAFYSTVEQRMQWLDRYAPWMNSEHRAKIANLSAHWYSKRSLGQHLELYDDDRERLQAWTIEAVDVSDEQRIDINKEKERRRGELRRRKDGAHAREQFLADNDTSRKKPWLALSMSRAKYYRLGLHKRETGPSEPSLIITIPDGRVSLRTIPVLPEGWPFCANHLVLTDRSSGPFRVVMNTDSFEYREAA
jgi:hypothetical protein